MSTPPRSFAPTRSSVDAKPSPTLGQDAWRLSTAPSSARRATACTRSASRVVGPPRTPSAARLAGSLNMGASAATKGSGTNSETMPVRSASARIVEKWRATWPASSTWPNIIVAVVGRPAACAVSTTSSHSAVVRRPFASVARTPSSKISADVPGSESTPARRASARKSATGRRLRRAPWSTSSGDSACRCTPRGTARRTASTMAM